MAPEVIDLISSSPPYTERSTKPDNNVVTSKGHPKMPPLFDDFVFLSDDDFDDTIDLGEVVQASNKRQLSPQPQGQPPRKRYSSEIPSKEQPARTAVVDPIDLTDWENVPSVLPLPLPKKRNQPGLLDSDPFASSPGPQSFPQPPPKSDPFADSEPQSPPRDKEPPTGSNVHRTCSPHIITIPQSSDPISRPLPVELDHSEPGLFISSSIPDPTPAPAQSDPFASSPKTATTATTTTKTLRGEINDHSRTRPRYHDWDPISSSAPESRSFDSPRKSVVIDIDDSDDGSDDDDDGDNDDDDDDEFPDISNFNVARQRRRRRSLQRSQSEVVIPPTSTKSFTTGKKTKLAEDRARERTVKAAARELDKENKRREKQKAKEAKAREKERAAALAEVNKLRTDKKISTPEMMVDIPVNFNPTIKTQLEAMLEGLDVQFTTWESPVENVVKWRRKVRSRYNDDLGLWEPVPLRLEDEKHALVVMTAEEFVKLALDESLEAHVAKMVRHFGNHQVIYLLEGLTPWMRKNRSIRNRQFTSNVRQEDASQQQQQQQQQTTTAARRRAAAATAPAYVPEETIEDALLQLQVMHDVLIHHTTIPMETSQWISTFTQHISTVPYRRQRDLATLGAGFCMESGQVKTGEDARETYVQMLQEIVRVTQPIAYGIAAEFGNVSDLVCALEMDGPNRLEAVRKHANKDGAYSDRTIGQAVSRRIHKVFTGQDETSTDV